MNFLWLFFTAFGLIIFGIIPATIAVVGVFRAYGVKGDCFRWGRLAWQLFWRGLKRFWMLSFIFSSVCAGLILCIWVLDFQENTAYGVPAAFLLYLLCLVLPYFAVNEANFELSFSSLLKNSLLMPAIWSFTSIKIIIVDIITASLCYLLPGLIPIIAFSVPLFLSSSLLTVRWNKQLRSIGRQELPIHFEL